MPESETKNEQHEDSDLKIIEQISTNNEWYDTNHICYFILNNKYFVYRAIEQDVLVQNPSSSNDASVLEKNFSQCQQQPTVIYFYFFAIFSQKLKNYQTETMICFSSF